MDTKKLRQKILDLAIHGRLVPQDPADEPASVLLDRIRQEKQRLIKEGKIRPSKKAKAASSDKRHYPYELPKGWAWTTVKEICSKFSTGPFGSMVHKSDYVETNGTPMVNPTNIKDGYIIGTKLMLVSFDKSRDLDKYRLSEKDIVLARRGDLTKCAIIDTDRVGWLCGTGSFFLHTIQIDETYFIGFYRSSYVQTTLKKECVGATMDNLNQNVLSNVRFPLPPLSEQRRIVAEIERWFALIDQIEQGKVNVQAAIKQAKAKVLDLAIHGQLVPQDPADEPAIELLRRINPDFVPCDNGHYPKGWCETNIDTLFFHNTGKALNASNQEGFMQSYLTTSNVYWGKFDFTVVKQMRFREEELSKCTVSKGDLLVCEGGDVGRSAIWPFDYDICIQNHIHRLRPKCELCVPYAFYVLKYSKDHNLIGGKGIGLLGLSANALGKIVIPLPPLAEQRRIVHRIEKIFAVLDRMESSLQA